MLFKITTRNSLRFAFIAIFWIAGLSQAFAGSTCATDQLDIRSATGTYRFQIEVVDTPELRAQGLMHREQMATFAGMLFVYDNPQPMRFWMSNTLIPLDMLFIDSKGMIAHIHENAIPLDETTIFGGDAIQYVFEINGGLSETLGITVGSAVRHAAITGPEVIWACE